MANKNKKLLFFQPSLRAGGAERFSLDLAKNLRSNGYEISFLLFADGGYFLSEALDNGFSVVVLKKTFKFDLVNLFKCRREISKINPDVIVCRLGANLYGPYIKGKAKILAIEDNVNLDETKIMSALKSLAYKKTDKIVAVSKTVKADAITRYGVNSDQVSVIYNGLDFSRFPKYLKEKNEVPVIVSMGRLVPQKNYSLLLKALADIKLDFKCFIAGEGLERDSLQLLINDLDLQTKVFLIGLKKDVGHFLSGADLFVLSSLWEGLGIVVLEAGYYGLPVLVSNIPSIQEVVSKDNGYLFETNNQTDLVEKLNYILTNISSPEILGKSKSLQNKIEKDFSITEMGSYYDKILQSL